MTDEQTITEAPEIERFAYTVGVDRKGQIGEGGKPRELVVHLAKPTDEQLLVLLRLVDLAEDDPMGTVRLYGDVVDALMDAERGEPLRVQRWLLQGRVTALEVTEIGMAAIRHWFPGVMEAQEAPKHGPTARRRRRP